MTDDISEGPSAICQCGRPLRALEEQCPHCTWVAALRWKQRIKTGAKAASAVPALLLTAKLLVALVTKGAVKPRA
jgi:hypothetical protein